MFDTQAVRESFGRAADRYDDHAYLQKQVRQHCLTLAKTYWPAGSHILDVGSGTGRFAYEACELGWRITGLDLASGMCKVARSRVVNADALAMPFAPESFDGIFSSLMLQWINDTPSALSEMARVLKPGAHAVISTLVAGTLAELRAAFAAVDGRSHVSEFLEPHRLLAVSEQAGFQLAQARQAPLVEHYPDAIALMRALQAIGATHKQAGRHKGLMTPQQFARMEKAYEIQRSREGLPATWQVLSLVLRKA
jgi:malonyl-CoA O-methyltransferase